MACVAMILAAGSGKRMNSATKKQYLSIKNKPILVWTMEAFQQHDSIDGIVVVTGEEDIPYIEEMVNNYGIHKVGHIVAGGKERQDSVYAGLSYVNENDMVLIHDGVRPFIKGEQIDTLINTLAEYSACAVGVPVKDTIKVVDDQRIIEDTPERSKLWAVQTPQGFTGAAIKKAHELAKIQGYLGTDDTVLIEHFLNKPVKMVMGDYSNIKITTQEDLLFGEFVLDTRR